MALPSLISSSLTSCLRSSRTAPAQQPLSLLSSPRTMLFKTHAVKSANTHVSHVTHGPVLRAPNSHLLCSVMLLDKRFVLTCHHPKNNWSCVRRQGHDSVLTTLLVLTRSPGRTSHRVLSHPRTLLSCSSSAASVGIVPHGQWAHHDKLRLALIDRSAKLMEPSLCLDRDTCAHTLRCCAHATSYSCLWRPILHCKTASGRPVLASRMSILALSSWPATSLTVEDQPRT